MTLLCHDGQDGLVVSEVDGIIVVHVGRGFIVFVCHKGQNALCIGEVNNSIPIHIADNASGEVAWACCAAIGTGIGGIQDVAVVCRPFAALLQSLSQ